MGSKTTRLFYMFSDSFLRQPPPEIPPDEPPGFPPEGPPSEIPDREPPEVPPDEPPEFPPDEPPEYPPSIPPEYSESTLRSSAHWPQSVLPPGPCRFPGLALM